MPELPEVEIVRRGLERVTLRQPIQSVQVLLPRTVATPLDPRQFELALGGCQFISWQRFGKYLLAELADGSGQPAGSLGVHLRMTGKMLWMPTVSAISVHTRVRFTLAENMDLRFEDQRTFGQMWWVAPDQAPREVIAGLQRLGPEPFSDSFTAAYLRERLRHSRRPIKNALLDQRLVAGVGNIYADEALHLSGIRPLTASGRLGPVRLQRLRDAVRDVLQASIEAGGTTFSDYRDIYGTNGNYGGVAWVYDRAGQPCRRCGAAIQRLKLAGRSAHYCPKCQR